jgi:hypothetical protein
MAKQPKTELIVAAVGFDYSPLTTQTAKQVRAAAERIREKVKKTLEDIIAVGNDLLTVKQELPHGQFGTWLRAEFGWTERTARNFMSVAEGFGAKTEMISDLQIAPTAAYLLAAPSAPDEARQAAVERAEAGEQVTTAVAKEILAEARKKESGAAKKAAKGELAARLAAALVRYRERWDPKGLAELARQLREFADSLGKPKTDKKSGKGRRRA